MSIMSIHLILTNSCSLLLSWALTPEPFGQLCWAGLTRQCLTAIVMYFLKCVRLWPVIILIYKYVIFLYYILCAAYMYIYVCRYIYKTIYSF